MNLEAQVGQEFQCIPHLLIKSLDAYWDIDVLENIFHHKYSIDIFLSICISAALILLTLGWWVLKMVVLKVGVGNKGGKEVLGIWDLVFGVLIVV